MGIQLGNALLALAIAAALAAWLLRCGRNPREALWWAWCPTVMVEAGNGGQVDVLSAALVLGAVLAVTTRRGRAGSIWLAGILLGAAASVKITPLVLLPAFIPWREKGIRRSWQAHLSALGTLVTSSTDRTVSPAAKRCCNRTSAAT